MADRTGKPIENDSGMSPVVHSNHANAPLSEHLQPTSLSRNQPHYFTAKLFLFNKDGIIVK